MQNGTFRATLCEKSDGLYKNSLYLVRVQVLTEKNGKFSSSRYFPRSSFKRMSKPVHVSRVILVPFLCFCRKEKGHLGVGTWAAA